MINRIIITIFICFLPSIVFSQISDSIKFRNNAVYAELLGNMGFLYSVNYERKIYEHQSGFFTARIGGASDLYSFLVGPVLINHIFFNGKNHLEIGGGFRLETGIGRNKSNELEFFFDREWCWPTMNIMYRFQKPRGRFLFRAGWTPLFLQGSGSEKYFFLAFFGISAGYAFK